MKINLIFKLILPILLFILISVESAPRVFTYNEIIPKKSTPRIFDLINYRDDSTLVIRIVYKDPTAAADPTKAYLEEKLSLRVLFQNGTVNAIDLDLQIPSMNYALAQLPIGVISPIKLFSISRTRILVTYINTTNATDVTTYEDWGMVIDLNGNIISKRKFGDSYINNGVWNPSLIGSVTPNINGDKGWLWTSFIRNTFSLSFKQFNIVTNEIVELSEGKTPIASDISGAIFRSIATAEEDYAIILANTTKPDNNPDPLKIRGQMFIFNIEYNTTDVSTPKFLYQIPLDNIIFNNMKCDIDYIEVGHSCILTLNQTITSTTTPPQAPTSKLYYIRVSFLSSGSVSGLDPIDRVIPADGLNTVSWNIRSLPYGGFLIDTRTINATGSYAIGYLYDDVKKASSPWDFGQAIQVNAFGRSALLANNSVVLTQPELPDNGYYNLHVQSTVPPIGTVITPTSDRSTNNLNQVSITYSDEVELSEGAISVYLVQDGGNNVLRQKVFGTNTKYCNITSNALTVTFNIISSTFSQQSSNYYIKVDNNFVRDKKTQEPLLGIQENIWKISTDSATGLLRLTSEGTAVFESLNSEGQKRFFNTLVEELASIVPIDKSRLSSNGRTQVDPSVSPKRQFLISVDIEQTKDKSSRSVEGVIGDLNVMISESDATPISSGTVTKYLDPDYGLQATQNLWERNKLKFLGLFLGLAVLVTLFLIAQRRESKGRNIVILQLGLIISDMVMDVVFLINNGKQVEVLYIPCVVFITVPIAVNTVLAFTIITNENSREVFYKWFSAHGKVASIFTVLAGADIDALTILQSNLAGFAAFNAPFSNDAITKIFWGACANIFLEDLPQVIVQVLYQQKTVSYDIVPLLTLISSCLNLTINIIGRAYNATNSLKRRHDTTASSSFDDDFGNISDNKTLEDQDQQTLNKELLIDDRETKSDSNKMGFNVVKRLFRK
ncbi:9132_t:CDS:2 [Entrophospora sp. SA101]|nr:9132_t:CDS:2 [Entrophospora sp. SA101]CAJ0828819.1 6095_t:CDS:2 [Entrophospora sp. SA101]